MVKFIACRDIWDKVSSETLGMDEMSSACNNGQIFISESMEFDEILGQLAMFNTFNSGQSAPILKIK